MFVSVDRQESFEVVGERGTRALLYYLYHLLPSPVKVFVLSPHFYRPFAECGLGISDCGLKKPRCIFLKSATPNPHSAFPRVFVKKKKSLERTTATQGAYIKMGVRLKMLGSVRFGSINGN
jgi:hypothetical protein